MKRVPTDSLETRPYPTCDAGGGETLVERVLRSGPRMTDQDVVESYRFVREPCRIVATVLQTWGRGVSEVEVVYDLDFVPLRAWKRSHVPRRGGGIKLVDIRRYELRTDAANVLVGGGEAGTSRFWFRGGKPIAVVGPGRGLLYAFIRSARLEVGEKVRGPVLDIRSPVESVQDVTLRRDPDRIDEVLGRRVRVYTIFGREPVFTDENDVVIGDLAGLVPASTVSGPPPRVPMPETPPDPAHTP